jgi:hypothetical protein
MCVAERKEDKGEVDKAVTLLTCQTHDTVMLK